MRLARLALFVPLLLAPAAALGVPWNGVTPGTSTQPEIEKKFGEPSKRTKHGNGSILAYFGTQATEGTKQMQFQVDSSGVVQEITIFLDVPLDGESLEGTYGKPTQKTFTDTTFKKVWVFGTKGVIAYWNKEGNAVEAIAFGLARGGAGKAEPSKPAGDTAAKPAATEAKSEAAGSKGN